MPTVTAVVQAGACIATPAARLSPKTAQAINSADRGKE